MISDTTRERNTSSMQSRSMQHIHWCWLANDVYDRFGSQLGADGLTLYIGLARYAHHRTGKCWPSLERISVETGTPVERLEAVLPLLVKLGLVAMEERPGRSPMFTLLAIPAASVPRVAPVPPPVPVAVEVQGNLSRAREDLDLRTKQEEEKKESCIVRVEEGKKEERRVCAPAVVSTLPKMPPPDDACVEALSPLETSPYELSEASRVAQCAVNQHGLAGLFASLWPEEVAARDALRQREAEARQRHPHTEIIHGSCTVCGEILEPAADEEPVR